MKTFLQLIFILYLAGACAGKKSTTQDIETVTFCNPMNLSYRFQPDEPSRREAADPSVIWFGDRYYLFASKSGGYWHSMNLAEWTFLATEKIPTEEYAPTAIVK
jgi:xylan 1,4-beta-xylosidase